GGREVSGPIVVPAVETPQREGNVVAIEGDEPVVGDGDTMSITAEIADDLFRPAEGGFGINNPILPKQRSEEHREVFRFRQMVDRSGAGQPFLVMSGAEAVDELSTKNFGESFDGQQERGFRVNPAFLIRRDSASRNDAVNVGMKVTTFRIP